MCISYDFLYTCIGEGQHGTVYELNTDVESVVRKVQRVVVPGHESDGERKRTIDRTVEDIRNECRLNDFASRLRTPNLNEPLAPVCYGYTYLQNPENYSLFIEMTARKEEDEKEKTWTRNNVSLFTSKTLQEAKVSKNIYSLVQACVVN